MSCGYRKYHHKKLKSTDNDEQQRSNENSYGKPGSSENYGLQTIKRRYSDSDCCIESENESLNSPEFDEHSSNYLETETEPENGQDEKTKRKKKGRKTLPYSLVHPIFDPYISEVTVTQPVNPKSAIFDQFLDEAIQQRLSEITPEASELENLGHVVNKVTIVLEQLKNKNSIDFCKIEDVTVVGSYRMGTILRGHRIADIVILLRTLPIKSALQTLGHRILDELTKSDHDGKFDPFDLKWRDDMIQLTNTLSDCSVLLRFTSNCDNLEKLLSPSIHISKSKVKRNMQLIKQIRWCEENIKPKQNVIQLIRIMKDIADRFHQQLEIMNRWMITVMSHHCVEKTLDNISLPLSIAFKRFFQLSSSGFFLPYCAGVNDPIDERYPIHGRLPVDKQEYITLVLQTMFRVLNQPNGINYILHVQPIPDIGSEIEQLFTNGIVL